MKQHAVSGNVTIATRLEVEVSRTFTGKPESHQNNVHLHPKRSCGKVKFSHVSVKLLTGGTVRPYPVPRDLKPPGSHPPPGPYNSLGPYPSGTLPPLPRTLPPQAGIIPPLSLGTTKAGGTHPTGMPSCYTSIFVVVIVCVVT